MGLFCDLLESKPRLLSGKTKNQQKDLLKMDFEKEMAMFRYAVITPLLHGNDERSLKKRVREQAAKIWTLPNGRLRQFSWGGSLAATLHPKSYQTLPFGGFPDWWCWWWR